MKKIKFLGTSLVLALASLVITPAMAQQSGHGPAPHGGKMVDVDSYHIEMVKGNNSLIFYVLDDKAKALNVPASGSLEYVFANGKKSKVKLTDDKKGGLQVGLPKDEIHESCIVTIKVDGKTLTGKFKNEVTAAEKGHGHQH